MRHALTLVNPPAALSPEELGERMIERRAVEAAIWGMPLVSVDAMRQAFLHEGKYGDILYFSRPATGSFRSPHPMHPRFMSISTSISRMVRSSWIFLLPLAPGFSERC